MTRIQGTEMIVNMFGDATEEQIDHVVERIKECGYQAHLIRGEERTVIGIVGNSDKHRSELEALRSAPGVEEMVPISHPFKLAARSCGRKARCWIWARASRSAERKWWWRRGRARWNRREQINDIAASVAKAGAKMLRGGAFKPRTSPYSFQGMGEEGLKLMRARRRQERLAGRERGDGPVANRGDAAVRGRAAGGRAQHAELSPAARRWAKSSKPVLLKRGMSATLEELLLSAEYIMAGGNYKVILCERGIRTFETYMRNTLDIAAIPVIKQLSHLPIVADPSHGTGRRDKVAPMARAAVAAGADGLIIEVHPDPEHALSDGAQSLYPDQFAQLMNEIRAIAPAVGREVA